jgi:membrane-associated protease RseP (regulator of RpoE activity)
MQRYQTTLCWLAGLGLLIGAAGMSEAAAAGDKTPGKVFFSQKIVAMDDDGAGDHPIEYRVLGKPVPRGYLGIGLTDLTPELRTHFGVPQESGVMVSKIDAGSPAEKAGLKVGDILTAYDGKPVASSFDLRQRVRAADDGAAATLEVWRGGKVQTVTASLEKRDRPEVDIAPLLLRKKDGDRMILSLDGEELPLPDKLTLPFQPNGGQGRLRVQTLNSREAELEKRLKELEKRIKDLEHQLGASAAPAPKQH